MFLTHAQTPSNVAVGGPFRLALWKDAPQDWSPALVMLCRVDDTFVRVMLDDDPVVPGENGFYLPTDVAARHFEPQYDSVCPTELQGAFNELQKYLINENLPMMSPLSYARSACLVYEGASCAQAIEASARVEGMMKAWVAESIKLIKVMERPKT